MPRPDFQDVLASATQRLVPLGARLIVGTSGGPDSQALLHGLCQIRATIGLGALRAVGVDHGLRETAKAELDLAEDLARKLEVPFQRVRVSVSPRGNVMANAREARYAALEEARQQQGADGIAVAHTATDQLETVLMRLVQGAGISGMLGIPERRGNIIRPMLGVSRQDVVAYASTHGLPYAADPNNLSLNRARGILRREVLPGLYRLNPRAEQGVGRFVRLAQDDERFLQNAARRCLRRASDPLPGLQIEPLQDAPPSVRRRAVRLWLAHQGVRLNQDKLLRVEQHVLRAKGRLTSAAGQLVVERGRLFLHTPQSFDDVLLAPGDEVGVPGFPGARMRCELVDAEIFAASHGGGSSLDDGKEVAFDADRLHLSFRIRPPGRGERFRPFGSGGHIKLGDLFTNYKIPTALRSQWPILVGGSKAKQGQRAPNGDILWVVGLRRGCAAPLSPDTRKVLIVRLVETALWTSR